jgi:hypothetical protein
MACECLRMQGQRSGPDLAVHPSSPAHQPPTESQLGFLGEELSLRCLRLRFRAIIEGQCHSGVNGIT